MLQIVKSGPNGNGTISGRGLRRRKLTVNQRIDLAADLVSGRRQLVPSFQHAAALLQTTPTQVRERLAQRQEAERRLQAQEKAERTNAEAEILADAWRSVAPESREVAIQLLGSSAVWDVLARVVA